jgi:hypothetical protein
MMESLLGFLKLLNRYHILDSEQSCNLKHVIFNRSDNEELKSENCVVLHVDKGFELCYHSFI